MESRPKPAESTFEDFFFAAVDAGVAHRVAVTWLCLWHKLAFRPGWLPMPSVGETLERCGCQAKSSKSDRFRELRDAQLVDEPVDGQVYVRELPAAEAVRNSEREAVRKSEPHPPCVPLRVTPTPFEGSSKEVPKGKAQISAPLKGSKGAPASIDALLSQLGNLMNEWSADGQLECRTRLRDWIHAYFRRYGDQTTDESVPGRMADTVLSFGQPARKVLAEALDAIAAEHARGKLRNAGALATFRFRRNGYALSPRARDPPTDKPRPR